jgi:DNA-binding NtrC family response regulator
MPHIDGFDLMKRMKEKRPSSDFILITAHKSVEVVTRARRLGAAYIFYKPVDLEEIINAIEIMHKRYLYWLERLSEVS